MELGHDEMGHSLSYGDDAHYDSLVFYIIAVMVDHVAILKDNRLCLE